MPKGKAKKAASPAPIAPEDWDQARERVKDVWLKAIDDDIDGQEREFENAMADGSRQLMGLRLDVIEVDNAPLSPRKPEEDWLLALGVDLLFTFFPLGKLASHALVRHCRVAKLLSKAPKPQASAPTTYLSSRAHASMLSQGRLDLDLARTTLVAPEKLAEKAFDIPKTVVDGLASQADSRLKKLVKRKANELGSQSREEIAGFESPDSKRALDFFRRMRDSGTWLFSTQRAEMLAIRDDLVDMHRWTPENEQKFLELIDVLAGASTAGPWRDLDARVRAQWEEAQSLRTDPVAVDSGTPEEYPAYSAVAGPLGIVFGPKVLGTKIDFVSALVVIGLALTYDGWATHHPERTVRELSIGSSQMPPRTTDRHVPAHWTYLVDKEKTWIAFAKNLGAPPDVIKRWNDERSKLFARQLSRIREVLLANA